MFSLLKCFPGDFHCIGLVFFLNRKYWSYKLFLELVSLWHHYQFHHWLSCPKAEAKYDTLIDLKTEKRWKLYTGDCHRNNRLFWYIMIFRTSGISKSKVKCEIFWLSFLKKVVYSTLHFSDFTSQREFKPLGYHTSTDPRLRL